MTFPFPSPAAIVSFNYPNWIASFPEMAGCSPTQGQAFFDRADSFFANDACNPAIVLGETRFTRMLYLMTSHLAFLYAPRDANGNPAQSGSPSSPLVGRLNSASEGSVSVGSEWKGAEAGEEFYIQTKYGAEFWQAMAPFRTFRYAAQPTVVAQTVFPYVPSVMRRRW
jgi:hypothetical protein